MRKPEWVYGSFVPIGAAVVSVVYGLFVSTTATVMFVTAAASLFSYVLTRARLDVAISTALQEITVEAPLSSS